MVEIDAKGSMPSPAMLRQLILQVREADPETSQRVEMGEPSGYTMLGLDLNTTESCPPTEIRLCRADGTILGRIFNLAQPQETPMPELPLYQCHKKVRAAEIATVEIVIDDETTCGYETATITFVDPAIPPRRYSLARKPKPSAGWYLVEYDNGYLSFSPAKEFEEGYTLVEQVGGPFRVGDLVVFSEASGNPVTTPKEIIGGIDVNGRTFYILDGLPGSLFLASSLQAAVLSCSGRRFSSDGRALSLEA